MDRRPLDRPRRAREPGPRGDRAAAGSEISSARPLAHRALDAADELGCREELFPGWTGPEQAFEEWKRVSKEQLADYSGLSYSLIEEHNGIQWPFPEGTTR